MSGYAIRLGESTDVRVAGGKGANLGRLIAAGFPVPDGFVIGTAAYRDFVDAAGLARTDPARMREAIPLARIPERIADDIAKAYAALGSPAVAVRSSGTAEDLGDASFAGQHDTYLNVSGEAAVLRAVRDCWASLWTPRAIGYRGRRSWDEQELALAVVIQRMVDAEWAGVLFTADPLSGRRDRMVLEAVRGLGEALVSGEATGIHAELDKTTRTVLRTRPAIPSGALAELARLGTRVEALFGVPQDIEWAYARGHCALVQARPLTALPDEPAEPEPEETAATSKRRRRRPMGNFAVTADHIPYPPYPMDLSLIFRPAMTAILGAVRSAGFAVPAVDEILIEIGDGVVQIAPPRPRATWRATIGIPITAPRLARLLRTRPEAWNAHSERTLMPRLRRLDAEDLAGLTEQELLDRALEPIRAVGALMPSRFAAVVPGMAAGEILRRLLRVAFGTERAEELHGGLMSEVPCVTTAANAELERIAATVRGTPALRELYRGGEPGDMADRLRETAAGRALLADVEGYQERYGFRAPSMFTVGDPPIRETSLVHGLLKGLAQIEEGPARSPGGRFDRAREEVAAGPGIRARLLRPAMGRLLGPARSAIGFREDSHYVLETSLAVARRMLLELGRRLMHRGALPEAEDIVYLELEELGVPNRSGEPMRGGLTEIVGRRRAARARALEGYSIFPEGVFDPAEDDGAVRGTPASRGRVEGTVRVVRGEADFSALRPGEILVCPYTNPTWTPLFSVAAAVVVDSGGSTSHAAIVAREVGIPAIMGTGEGTRMLHDGQRVLVDADRGIVELLG